MPDLCRSCKAPIRWALTEAGHAIPLDLDPADDGNIRLAAARPFTDSPRAIVIPEDRRAEFAGELYRPHFASCPYADRHRRRRTP